MNPHVRQTLLEKVRPGQPHTDDAVTAINRIADVGARFDAAARKLEADRDLTPVGRGKKMAELVRELGKQFARASRPARVTPAYIQAQKAALKPPTYSRDDLAAHFRGAEVRNHLCNLPPGERVRLATELANDPEQARAIFSAPAYLSGLDDAALKMPKADIYNSLRNKVVEKLHGPRLAELNRQASDYEAVTGAAGAVRTELFRASGLSQRDFDQLMQPLEAEADGPPPAPRPASTPSASSYQFDEEAFRADLQADLDRVWADGLAKAIAETKAEMFGNSGGGVN